MTSSKHQPRPGIPRSIIYFGGFVILVGLLLAADWFSAVPEDAPAGYVGGNKCIECHQQQGDEWEGSHHDLAMGLATDETVLGDFDSAELVHHGVRSRMFRDGDKFMVHTEGPDGEMADFQIKYVFGVEPLQQYMVEFEPPSTVMGNPLHSDSVSVIRPTVGRIQVLRISWDTERNRWFHLDPPDVEEKLAANDPLHWTGSAQNWNHMCAECHSTNLKKNFDTKSLTYHTTFSEINVSCEACHGPGSIHAEIAESKWVFWDRNHGYGLTRMRNADSKVQIETCAPCHSRRAPVAGGFACGASFDDHYAAELLTPATYYPDGQILDEVYVYGSFLQSKMYHNGIRCTDCHNPHSNKLKFNDNRLCTSCHQHDAAKYDTVAHHHHPGAARSAGTNCVDCHMPATPYMDVDLRRDHSFKSPRPDLSIANATPNACAGCHVESNNVTEERRSGLEYYADWMQAAREGDEEVLAELERVNKWAADLTKQWYPSAKSQDGASKTVDYASIFRRAWDNDLDSTLELAKLADDKKVAGMIRASAIDWMRNFPPEQVIPAASRALEDKDPQVRAAAIPLFLVVAPPNRVRPLVPMLADPVRNVRMQAALMLADAPRTTMSDSEVKALSTSLQDYRSMMLNNGDQANAHMAIALLDERMGDLEAAESAYRTAIRVQPLVTGPRSNLAALLDQKGPSDESTSLRKAELALIERDSGLAPNDANIQYRLGLAYYVQGDYKKAVDSLKRTVELQPDNANFAVTLVLLYQKLGRFDDALKCIQDLLQLRPDNQMFLQLHNDISLQRAAAGN